MLSITFPTKINWSHILLQTYSPPFMAPCPVTPHYEQKIKTSSLVAQSKNWWLHPPSSGKLADSELTSPLEECPAQNPSLAWQQQFSYYCSMNYDCNSIVQGENTFQRCSMLWKVFSRLCKSLHDVDNLLGLASWHRAPRRLLLIGEKEKRWLEKLRLQPDLSETAQQKHKSGHWHGSSSRCFHLDCLLL